ncbi:ATP-binding cassette domain-containing protein [Streptomyces sp. NPDC003077]|uniref:ATP-binding cassette domain-containing protein n=1 Tax=Streptomyces sp. NPDC003077 TaxID=3154443 RepID=UPI0033AD234A
MIQAIGLTSDRRRGLPRAVDDLTFEAPAGRITVLLGARGAGKTTALRLMLHLQSGRGIALFRGRPFHRMSHPARELGVVLGDVPGHPARTARGQLRMLGAAAGVPADRAGDVLDLVGLGGLADHRLDALSRGMDRRLGLAAALLGDPHTLLLDEPSDGLSPREAAWLHGMLRGYVEQGGTVLLTSRDAKEAARCADRVVTVDAGRLVADQDAADFARTRLRPRVVVRSPQAGRLAALLVDESQRSPRNAHPALGCSVEVVRESGSRIAVYGSTCAAVGEVAFRHGILVHRLAEETGYTGPVTALARADGRPSAPGPVAMGGLGAEPVAAPVTGRGASVRSVPSWVSAARAVRDAPFAASTGAARAHEADAAPPSCPAPDTAASSSAADSRPARHGELFPEAAPDAAAAPAASGSRPARVPERSPEGAPDPAPALSAGRLSAQPSALGLLATTEPAPEPDSEPASADAAQTDSEAVSTAATQHVPEPASEHAPGPDASPASEATEQPVPEPAAEDAAQPVPEPVSEVAVQPVPEPAAQPVPEPASEVAAQPAPEPASEGAAQPVPEPAPERASEAVPGPAPERLSEPGPQPTEPQSISSETPPTETEAPSTPDTPTSPRRQSPTPTPTAVDGAIAPGPAARSDARSGPAGPPPFSPLAARYVIPRLPAPGPVWPVRYELLRAASDRTGLLAGGAAVALTLVLAVVLAHAGNVEPARALIGWPRPLPFPPAAVGAGLMGALAFGQEFRYPVLAPEQGCVPRRFALLAAKLLVSGVAAVLVGMVALILDSAAVWGLFGSAALVGPVDWWVLAAGWGALLVGCAWAGVLAAGLFRSTVLGLAAVLAVPLLIVPLVRWVWDVPAARPATGMPARLASAAPVRWPSGTDQGLSAVLRPVVQPVGGALLLSLVVLVCAYTVTVLCKRAR